jgi:hypothetical protein
MQVVQTFSEILDSRFVSFLASLDVSYIVHGYRLQSLCTFMYHSRRSSGCRLGGS